MTRTLAFRRHKLQLKKEKVSRYNVAGCTELTVYGYECASTAEEKIGKFIGKIATTPKRCSCHMCGNPRKHWGTVSMQEKRAFRA